MMRIALLLVVFIALLGVSCSPAVRLASGCAADSVSHQDLIEWDEEPTIGSDGYMTMSGRTREGAMIRAPGSYAVFNFNDFREVEGSGVEKAVGGGQLKELGGIVSATGFAAEGRDVRAEEWDVSSDSFRVHVLVPDHLESEDVALVVVVWGENLDDGALGLACVKTEK